MVDLYFTEEGDMAVAPNGDLALTQANWRDDLQQVYIRMMTDVGDHVLHPMLGSDLSQLFGEPQTKATGALGVRLIEKSLEREGRFVGRKVEVQAVPVSPVAIRFDVYITSGSREKIKLSIEQDLGVV